MDERELDAALEPLKRLLERRETVFFEKKLTHTSKYLNKTEVHLMASFDFESLKQKITETANTVVGKTTEFAKDVAGKSSDAAKSLSGKAQIAAKKAKLNVEIASERSALKEKYTELGKLYFEKYAGQTDPDFAATVAALEEGLDKIEAKQAEISALDAQAREHEEAEEPVEADHVVDEVEDTVEAAQDAAADIAEETAQEAQKVYEETVDTVANPKE